MTETPQKRRAPRWMRVLLVLSLAANLLIVGVVAGAVSSGKRGGSQSSALSFGPYTAALTSEDRRALRKAIREEGGRFDRSAARANFQSFLDVLRTEPLDVAEMTRLFEAQGEMARTRDELGKDALLTRISEMSAEERAGFADRFEEAMRRGPRKRD